MRFQVPQNLDIPDTIFLGLSFSQLIYLGGALGATAFLLVIGGSLLAFLVGGPIILLALFLAFYNPNNQSSFKILRSVLVFMFRNKKYLWRKEENEVYTRRSLTNNRDEEKKGKTYKKRAKKMYELDEQLIFDDGETNSDPDVII